MQTIKGTIMRILFHNQENGYTVASFLIDPNNSDSNKKIFGKSTTIVGIFARPPVEEEDYELDGDYIKDQRYGLQFRFTSYQLLQIQTELGVISYLSSALFPGVGVKAAKKVVEGLGVNAIEKIKKDPKVLDSLGLANNIKSSIQSGIISDENNQAVTIFFIENGLTLDAAHKVMSALKDDNNIIETIKKNPYQLMDILERFGFKKADKFAEKIGIKKNAMCRIVALVNYSLKDMLYNSGNSYINKKELYDGLTKYSVDEISIDNFNKAINYLIDNKKILVNMYDQVFDYYLYQMENDLAEEVVNLLKNQRSIKNPLKSYDIKLVEKKIQDIIEESDIEYSKEQLDAIKAAFSEPIVIITGGPGTGKTTIIHAILKLYFMLNGDNQALKDYIALIAPTGRAAKRLKETTNMNAMTIHKFLGYSGDGHFEYDKYNKTDARLIIVDEASMMDLPLASRLITSMNFNARIIIVGDVDQLPSVGPGQVLKDLIDTREIKTVRLTKIHRQAEDSSIINLAYQINQGLVPSNIYEKLNDRRFIVTEDFSLCELIVDLYAKIISRGKNIKDLQILIPMYKGDNGIDIINQKIQARINPEDEKGSINHLGRIFRINDKVIQLVNRAEKNIMNGDIGYVDSFIYQHDKIAGLSVSFDNLKVSYTMDELDDLTLAYAISIHKAQGSEFDYVIMPFTMQYFVMLKRKLIYTGVTRAKKTLFLIGDGRALQLGVQRLEIDRVTILKDKILTLLKNKNNIKQILEGLDNKKEKASEVKLKKNQQIEKPNNSIEDIGVKEINYDDFELFLKNNDL